MVRGKRRDQVLALDRHQLDLGVDLRLGHGAADHSHVELSPDQPLQLDGGGQLTKDQFDIGMAGAKLAQDVRQRRTEHRRPDEADR